MPPRTVLLRLMLWSLGIAAAAGVLTVLVHGGETAWRVVGTALTTALASGLMLPVSAMMDRKEGRSSGMAGMVAVMIEFLLAIILIWELLQHLWQVRREEELAVSMVVIAVAAVFTMVFLYGRQTATASLSSRVGLFVTAVTTTASLLATWWWPGTGVQDNWAGTAVATGLFGLLVVLGLIGYRINDPRSWRWAGVAASGFACVMLLVNIWIGTKSDLGTVVFTALVGLAVVVAHANVSLIAPLAPQQRWVRTGAILAAALSAMFIEAIVVNDAYFDRNDTEKLLPRLAGASGIVAACGTMALVVLARLNRRVDYEPLLPEMTKISLICPQCRKKQRVPIGDSVCPSCQLRISIRIEEPRCQACGYLLYGLPTDRCPECGTTFSRSAEPAGSLVSSGGGGADGVA